MKYNIHTEKYQTLSVWFNEFVQNEHALTVTSRSPHQHPQKSPLCPPSYPPPKVTTFLMPITVD